MMGDWNNMMEDWAKLKEMEMGYSPPDKILQKDESSWVLYDDWRQAHFGNSPPEAQMEQSRVDGNYYLDRIVPSQLKYGLLESRLNRESGEEMREMFFFGLTDLSNKSTGPWGDGGRYWWRSLGEESKYWYLGSRDWGEDAPVRRYLEGEEYLFKIVNKGSQEDYMNSFWLWRWGKELFLSDNRKHYNFFIISKRGD